MAGSLQNAIDALDADHLTARDVMVSRESVTFLRSGDSLDTNLQRMEEAPRAGFPLVDGDADSFLGIVYTPALLGELDALEASETTLADVAAPPLTVDADTAASQLIDRFQDVHQELALVREEGHVVGLVTVTDAMEAITGEGGNPLDTDDD